MTITDGQRRRWRRIMMLSGIPLVIVGVVVSTKFFATEVSANASITAYGHRAFQEAAQQTEPLFWWNFYEQWKAPYDKGVALGMSGDHQGALEQLTEALELHPEPGSPEFCMIYTNIVYVVEKEGDAQREAGDRQAANEAYRQALDLIDQAPEGCVVDPAEGDPNIKEQLEESVPRIEAKIEEDDGGGDGESGPDDGEESPEGGEADEDEGLTEQERELREREREAERQRQEQEGYGQEEGDGGGTGVDRPW